MRGGPSGTRASELVQAVADLRAERAKKVGPPDPAHGLDEPMLELKAEVKFEADFQREVFTLDFSGQLNIIELGTVGATAGRFTLSSVSSGKSSRMSRRRSEVITDSQPSISSGSRPV